MRARGDCREERLPRWAQQLIATLRDDVSRAEYAANMARESVQGPEDSDTVIEPYDREPIRLGKGVRVRFILPGYAEDWHQYVDVRVTNGRLEVHSGGSLVIRPNVTNVVSVEVER